MLPCVRSPGERRSLFSSRRVQKDVRKISNREETKNIWWYMSLNWEEHKVKVRLPRNAMGKGKEERGWRSEQCLHAFRPCFLSLLLQFSRRRKSMLPFLCAALKRLVSSTFPHVSDAKCHTGETRPVHQTQFLDKVGRHVCFSLCVCVCVKEPLQKGALVHFKSALV